MAAQAADSAGSPSPPLQLTLPTDWQQVAQQGATPAPATTDAPTSPISDYFSNWFARVEQAQASQPHWMTPLVTVTPRLEQEVRYDQYWEHLGNGANVDQWDSGKGLELIPTDTNEVLLNPPPYLERYNKKPANGWNDWGFLTIKQRLLSANEENGDYILTAFLGVQAPSGNVAFTNHAWVVTPTIAGGWGWGPFDVQSTLGIQIPTDHPSKIGTAAAWNTALQLHLATYFWPEFETNITHWYEGARGNKTQVFLTPGIIFGRFHLNERLSASIGVGYQVAVSPKLVLDPAITPTYNHAWLVSGRVAF